VTRKHVSGRLFGQVAKGGDIARDKLVNHYKARSGLDARVQEIEKMDKDAARTYNTVSVFHPKFGRYQLILCSLIIL
jgi:hypothetical protein